MKRKGKRGGGRVEKKGKGKERKRWGGAAAEEGSIIGTIKIKRF